MQLGMVGLGRMGANMVRRLMRHGHQCVVYDLNPENVKALAGEGATGAGSMEEFVAALTPPRAAWVMVPAGDPTEQTVQALAGQLWSRGDAIIDGGNSYFKDDIRRAKACSEKGIDYLDVGTSGGIWGMERGYCLMIGGPEAAARRLDPIFQTLAPGPGDIPPTPGRERHAGLDPTAEQGYLSLRPVRRRALRQDGPQRHRVRRDAGVCRGVRHPQGGRQRLRAARFCFDLNVADIAEVWRRGSVIGSWLLDLTAMALAEDTNLDRVHRLRAGLRRGPLDGHGGASRRPCPPTCSRRRCTSGSAPGSSTPSPRRSSRRCA